MKFRKILFLLLLLAVFYIVKNDYSSVFANSLTNSENVINQNIEGDSSYEKETQEFRDYRGIVTQVLEDESGYIRLRLKDDEINYPEQVLLTIEKESVFFDDNNLEMKKSNEIMLGDKLTVIYQKSEINDKFFSHFIVRHDEASSKFIKIGKFDSLGLSGDNSLKLNLDNKENEFFDIYGNSLYNFSGGDALVFYSTTTKSLPPEVSSFILFSLDETEKTDEGKVDFISKDYFEFNDSIFVKLINVANQNGFDVNWIAETETVILSRDDLQIIFKLGEEEFSVNGRIFKFTNGPIVIDGRTYVETDFLDYIYD